jgi:DNA repair exonuclease SbcCD nuclease subunit
MSIRVVFFSDTHLGFDYPIRPRSDRPRRGPDFFANFQSVLDHARRTRADLVVHGGDFFFRSKVHPLIVDQAYQRLCEFADSGIDVVIVPGNHERSVLPPSLFLNHPHVHVLDRPRTYRFDIRNERLAISGFPYLKNIRGRFSAALVECQTNRLPADHRLLCLHHAVDGAVVGPGDFTFRNRADVIAGVQLPVHFDAVLAGHVHRRQVLPYEAPVVYCGSVERTSFAEKNETKGFCEVVLHRDASSPDITFHELATRPMVDFDARPYTQSTRLIDAFMQQSACWSSGAIIRVRLVSYPSKQLSSALTDIVAGPVEFSVFRASGQA